MKRLRLITAVLAVAGLAIPATANDQQTSKQQRNKQQQMGQQQAQRQHTVTGVLQDVRTVRIQGEQDKHVLGKLRTRDGRTLVVDLGTQKDLKGVTLRRNQPLAVQGKVGRINQRPVLMAEKIRGTPQPEATLTIVRVIPLDRQAIQAMSRQQGGQQSARQQFQRQQQTGQQPMAQRQQNLRQFRNTPGTVGALIEGELVDLRLVRVQGHPHRHLLAKVQNDQDQTTVIDLGPSDNKDLQDVNLKKGEIIAAVGEFGRINNRPVLVATHVSDLVTIDREFDQQFQQAQQAGYQQQEQQKPQRQQQQRQSGQTDQSY